MGAVTEAVKTGVEGGPSRGSGGKCPVLQGWREGQVVVALEVGVVLLDTGVQHCPGDPLSEGGEGGLGGIGFYSTDGDGGEGANGGGFPHLEDGARLFRNDVLGMDGALREFGLD